MYVSAKKEGADTDQVTAPQMVAANNAALIPRIASQTDISKPESVKFLALISEGERFTFQTFDDKTQKNSSLTRILHGTLDEHFSSLVELNKRGAGVFFTVNETDLKGRSAANIVKVRAVFVDLDGTSLAPVVSAPLLPHIIVESSEGRYHAYWIIEDMSLDIFSYVQKVLINKFNADKSVHDLPRVMRLPGFMHNKKDPFHVRVIEASGMLPYTCSHFLKEFGIVPNRTTTKVVPIGIVNDPVLHELQKRDMVIGPIQGKEGGWKIKCPFRNEHTTGDTGTAYFEPYSNGYFTSGFKCQHDHCASKNIDDLKEYLGIECSIDVDSEIWEEPIPLREELVKVAPFDEAMLPSFLRDWISDIRERMQVPTDFLAATCVVVLSSLIGRKCGIYPKAQDDWLVVPNLWGAIVGRPSLLKSPAIAEVLKPLEDLIVGAIESNKKEMDEYEQNEMWFEAKQSALKEKYKTAAKKANSDDEKPDFTQFENTNKPCKPCLKRYKTEDATTQKIGEILLENPNGLLVHRDELVGWLKSLDQYGREGDRAFFLESWNGTGSYTVDRIGRGTLHIPALCLSIIGGIQPGPLRAYVHQATTGGCGDDGLLQRFQLLVWPDASKEWRNVDRSPNKQAKEKAYEIFKRIDAFEPFGPSATAEDLKIRGLRFSPDAQEKADIWRLELENKLRGGDLCPALESHLGKYRSLMPSLALIFYLVAVIGKEEMPVAVDLESTLQAVRWCEYLETHARRLYAAAEDPDTESARALLSRIKKGYLPDFFSFRDVYYSKHWSMLDCPEKVTKAVKILEEFCWIKIKDHKTKGRPLKMVIVHPSLRKSVDSEVLDMKEENQSSFYKKENK
jgi:putative DNA primase/helicase